ncbi:MAG: metallophosphoesterase family protein [Candidatus Hodarchaeales archaeon]|jgi:putative phosphoesterase
MDVEYTLGVLSDPHSNLLSLQAVLEHMVSNYPVEKIAVLGDIVGYYSQPKKVLEQVLEVSDFIIKGNHDDAACKNYIPQDMNIFAARAIQYSIDNLSVDDKRRLNSLQPMETVELDGKTVQFCHGSPEYPLDEYIFNQSKQQDGIFEFMNFVNIDVIFLGHTHIPYVREVDGKIIANPGSSSQPRDGDNRPSYVVFDIKNGLGKIERVSYDYEHAIKLTLEAGLPPQLGERLRKGK